MELPNRKQIERDIAERLSRLSTRHRHELEDLVGYPPNLDNVPAEFWSRVKRDHETELVAILMLLFALSGDYHATLSGLNTPEIRKQVNTRAENWAVPRAREVSASYAESAERYATERLGPRSEAEKPVTPPAPPSQSPIEPVAPPEPEKPLASTIAVDDPIDPETYHKILVQIFGPENDARRAINEVTAAQSAGGDAGIELTVGLSIRDRWRTNPGSLPGAAKLSASGPCPVCKPLDGVMRMGWPDPRGPGEWIHSGCVCDILYANLPQGVEAAA